MAGSARVQYVGNHKSTPLWAKDFGGREHIAPWPAKIDPASFADAHGVKVTLAAAGTNSYTAGATVLAVSALTLPINPATTLITSSQGLVLIPKGTVLDFGGAGAKPVKLSADAKLGDTYISVVATLATVVAGDEATFSRYGTKSIPSGTLVGRTLAERDAGTAFGAAAATDDEIYLTYNDIPDVNVSDDVELYRHGSLVAENYLPQYTTLSAEVVTLTLAAGTDAGTFRVRNGITGATTAALAWDITAANLQTALRTLTGDTALTVGLSGEIYTVTYTSTFTPPPLTIVNDTTNDGGVDEGGIVVATTTASLLAKIRQLYKCIKGAA